VKPVRPVWSLQGGKFGFRAREESRFVSGGRDSGGWTGEFAGGEFAGRSPPRDQYEFGRGRSLEVFLRVDFRFLLIDWVLGTELLAKGSPRGTPTIPKVSL
jgi:hypothetical protein